MWLLVAFIVTTAVTRWVTRSIRAGSQGQGEAAAQPVPQKNKLIKNVHIDGVHVHHQVWGILLTMVVGLLLVTYHPGPGRLLNLYASLLGIGTALALDEFAMRLHLEDVYWSHEGRKSITALMTAGAIALGLMMGANPLDLNTSEYQGISAWWMVLSTALNFALAVICILKGKSLIALIGIFVPFVALIGAIRLAKPGSWWARRRYTVGSRKDRRSHQRFDEDYHNRWLRIRDAIGGKPTEPDAS